MRDSRHAVEANANVSQVSSGRMYDKACARLPIDCCVKVSDVLPTYSGVLVG